MLDIQKTNIAKLVNVLNGVGASYKIILPDGTEYGALETKPVKVKKARSKASPYPRGELRNYVLPFLTDLARGDVASVPYGSYPGPLLAARCYSTGHALWGPGGCTGSRNDKTQAVEILRLA